MVDARCRHKQTSPKSKRMIKVLRKRTRLAKQTPQMKPREKGRRQPINLRKGKELPNENGCWRRSRARHGSQNSSRIKWTTARRWWRSARVSQPWKSVDTVSRDRRCRSISTVPNQVLCALVLRMAIFCVLMHRIPRAQVHLRDRRVDWMRCATAEQHSSATTSGDERLKTVV